MCDIIFDIIFEIVFVPLVGAAVATWLVCSSPDRAVRVRAIAGDSVLYSWATANVVGSDVGLASHPGERRNTLTRFMQQITG